MEQKATIIAKTYFRAKMIAEEESIRHYAWVSPRDPFKLRGIDINKENLYIDKEMTMTYDKFLELQSYLQK